MIVPSVRIVISDNDQRAVPLRTRLDEVDRVDDKSLLVERSGVARMAVLKAIGLQERYRGKVARAHRVEEVMQVILMIHTAIGLSDESNRARAQMRRVRGARVPLEPFMMRNVIDLGDEHSLCVRT